MKIKEFNEEIYVEMLENGELYDYITNLQQENERLKELDENYPIEEELAEAYRREEDYKSRIEKALGKKHRDVWKEYSNKLKIGGFDSVWYGNSWKGIN